MFRLYRKSDQIVVKLYLLVACLELATGSLVKVMPYVGGEPS